MFYRSVKVIYKICVLIVGGMGADCVTGCVIAEELAYGCSGVYTAMEASGLGVSSQDKHYLNTLLKIISHCSKHPL